MAYQDLLGRIPVDPSASESTYLKDVNYKTNIRREQ